LIDKIILEEDMSKIYVIAEIGINHNGSVDIAKQLILKAKKSGCDAVKFQKRDINSVYTQEELDALRESPWGKTNRDQKIGLELSIDDYVDLYSYTKQLGLDFGVSCWDLVSLQLIENHLNVDFHKVASALLTHKTFLHALAETRKPIILSTGMSTQEEIDKAVDILGNNLTHVLACTSTYPSKPDEINLRYIDTLKYRYPNKKIGFSNHYSGHDACIAATARSAECIEFHITLDRTMYGSDQSASIENADVLVSGIRNIEKMIGTGEKIVYDAEVPILKKLRKVSDLA
jgi:N-acetylneuraminate synthase